MNKISNIFAGIFTSVAALCLMGLIAGEPKDEHLPFIAGTFAVNAAMAVLILSIKQSQR